MAQAREQLGLDLAWVSQFTEGQRVFRYTHGAAELYGVEIDCGDPLEDTFCAKVVAGVLPSLIPDARGLTDARDVDAAAAMGIATYVGVPIVFSDSHVFGTFCCVGSEARPHLSERDVSFLRVAATLVAEQLERDELAGRDRHAVRQRTQAAIDGPGLRPVFQPIYDLGDRHVLGYEALARFTLEPARTPDVWFAEAWGVQLGAELELAAARTALEHLDAIPDSAYLACNFSPASLLDDDVIDLIGDAPTDRLVVEITEHSPIEQLEPLRRRLQLLRGRGVRIALDDVGTGYATLNVLLDLRPEIHKIDLSIVRGVADDRDRRAMVAGLSAFARTIGALVVAEGIECERDLEALWELGVPAGQGYHLARPGPLPTPA
jgi:EAL domain-containing protein (putative c-di-GMP-specific phosphodiesterase class I)